MSPADATAVARITANLLDDPTTVALLRDLYTHARRVHARHVAESIDHYPVKHVWSRDGAEVIVQAGYLIYRLRGGTTILHVNGVTSARQVAQLLAAIGVLPERFIGGAR